MSNVGVVVIVKNSTHTLIGDSIVVVSNTLVYRGLYGIRLIDVAGTLVLSSSAQMT